MKIVSILGSPRSGKNTATMAACFADVALSLGGDVQTFELNQLTYRGCQGCYACKKTAERCVLNDDLTPVLEAIFDADVLLLASPVYFGDVTAQMKGFIDRCYSFLKPDYMTNRQPSRLDPKRLAFILCQGHPDENLFADIYPNYESFFKWMGFAEQRLIRACGYGPMTVDAIPEKVLTLTEDIARELLE